MQLIGDLSQANLESDTVLTIGAFDGVHRGHQYLISHLVSEARATGRLAALVTFHPHPNAVLRPYNPVRYLTTPGEKAILLERLDLDLVAILTFNKALARMPARRFVEKLCRHLRMKKLWVGRDFALGYRREGDVAALREMGREMGFEVEAIEPLTWGGEVISSSRIRALVMKGEVDKAAELLGRHYSLAGEVVRGAQRGRCLGFPTANLHVRPERVLPADGIYAVYAVLGEERYRGVANVGVRPTFENGERLVEIHILDFKGNIYGCDLVVEFVRRLRSERRFERVEDLVTQIRKDVEQARAVLKEVESRSEEVPMAIFPRFEEIDHVADRAIRVYGHDLKELFENAAYGMFALMANPDESEPTVRRMVQVEASDWETLLVAWLNELLFLQETEGEMYSRFQVQELTPTGLKALVEGKPGHATKAKVKAATFHNLAIEETPQGYVATLVFDT